MTVCTVTGFRTGRYTAAQAVALSEFGAVGAAKCDGATAFPSLILVANALPEPTATTFSPAERPRATLLIQSLALAVIEGRREDKPI